MTQAPEMTQGFALLLPEIALVVAALVLLLVGTARGERTGELVAGLSLAALGLAAFLLYLQPTDKAALFGGVFLVDGFARFMKFLTIAGAAFALLISLDYLRRSRLMLFEFPVLILFATAGMMVMISAGDLITLYLGVELQSLSLYVIAAFHRDSVRSSEAGLKYFVLGALSSGMLLYGASLVYGFAGSTQFVHIAATLKGTDPSLGIIFGLVFVMAGLAFKISAVPFHMWTPDVYEGAPTPVTAFFAAAPKIAAMAMLLRVVYGAFPEITVQWQQIVVFLAITSMVLGAFAAIGQRNIKRLMAYSSIGHMGYALVGLAAGTADGAGAVVYYLAIYLVTTLGTFAVILAMRRPEGMVEDIDELAGLARTNLPMAVILALLLFSLAGIPWLAGFFAKFYVFLAAVHAGLYVLAVIGFLASVVAAYYYLRIVKVMFFDEPAEPFEPLSGSHKLVMGAAGLFVLLYVIYPAPLVTVAYAAAKALF